MTLSRSVPEEPRPGYIWTCGMCEGLSLIESEEGLRDCPKCALASKYGVAFELVRRNVTPAAGAGERLASPAVQAPKFVYEVWEFRPEEGTARRVAVEGDIGHAYAAKWDAEEDVYGPVVAS